ncbi:MAG: hypothetical protein HZA36_03420 [Parcubacteria group bacterium]|nr:hypothetical protein [Parcubacteria group bacterium]
MDPHRILKKIGLDDKEIDVYLALIDLGPSTISDISRKTGIHRPALYLLLPALQEKEIIAISPSKKRRRYVAASPETIHRVAEDALQEINSLVLELKARVEQGERKPKITFLEGRKGIMSVFEDVVTRLDKDDVLYRYNSRKNIAEAGKYLPKNYKELRDKKRLGRFMITNEATKNAAEQSIDKTIKIIPKEFGLFDNNITQIVYKDTVAIIDYTTETALMIENQSIADFQKTVFKLLFSKL